MRLIDADTLKKDMVDALMYYLTNKPEVSPFQLLSAIIMTIDEWPTVDAVEEKTEKNGENQRKTVDAVEVVRCKDCRYAGTHDDVNGGAMCLRGYGWKYDAEFCSRGERRNTDGTA